MPKHSLWPASVKVGKPFECWTVLDNRVTDSVADPHEGRYQMKSLAVHNTVRLNNIVFSSSRAAASPIAISVFAGRRGSLDGYVIAPRFGTTLPEAPGLAGITTLINLQTRQPGVITTDALPLRAFPVKYLAHRDPILGGQEQLYLHAFTTEAPDKDQTLQGSADTFEVFHAWGDVSSLKK
jgi:hypothetical protein